MADRPKALAGILYSGESTLTRVVNALEAQRDIDLRIVLLGGFDQREAHRRLYEAFNDVGTDVDLFVKVDADMVILHDRLLAVAHSFLVGHPSLDVISVAVDDWLSGTQMDGMHLWRSTVRWTSAPPPLRTDNALTTARQRLAVRTPQRPIVLHAPDPTDLQAARFAARRVLKAATVPGHVAKWRTIATLVEKAITEPHPVRRTGVAAAVMAIEDAPRMTEFVLGLGEVDNVLAQSRHMASEWDVLAESALRLVRENLRRAEVEAAAGASGAGSERREPRRLLRSRSTARRSPQKAPKRWVAEFEAELAASASTGPSAALGDRASRSP